MHECILLKNIFAHMYTYTYTSSYIIVVVLILGGIIMASTHAKELCIICDQPKIKSYPLHKCSTCGKYLHRKCAILTPGSQSLNWVKCVPTGNSNNKKEKRDSTVKKQKNIGVNSPKRGGLILVIKVRLPPIAAPYKLDYPTLPL